MSIDPVTGPTDAEFVQLFGNQKRLRALVYLYRTGSATMPDIATAMDTVPSPARTHCNRLQRAGLVTKRTRGNETFWRLTAKGEEAAETVAKPLLDLAPGGEGDG